LEKSEKALASLLGERARLVLRKEQVEDHAFINQLKGKVKITGKQIAKLRTVNKRLHKM